MTTKVTFSRAHVGVPTLIPAVEIYDGDMFEYARTLASQGMRVALHNFANNTLPGLLDVMDDGTHVWLTNTQEEQLLRASTVDGKTFLPLDMYPISTGREVAGLYTPSVVFNRTPREGKLLPGVLHYTADVVTCAALCDPLLQGDEYAPGVENEVVKHMVLVLNMAKDADVFVTGLWGCGAFSHPIKASLKAWKRALLCAAEAPPEVHFCYMKDGLTMLLSPDEESVDVMAFLTY